MTPHTIPSSISDIDVEWLSASLSAYFDRNVEVSGLRVERIGTGQAGVAYRVIPTYIMDAGLPETFVVKLPAEDVDLRQSLAFGYRSEVSFYRRMAHHVKAPIPQCIHADINEDFTEFALLLNDLAPMAQGDQITGCSASQARAAVEALAGVHGPTWCDRQWLALDDVAMPLPGDADGAAMIGDVAVAATDIVLDRIGSELTQEDHDTLRTAMATVQPWFGYHPRFALMHGDFRVDNILFHPDDDAITIVDWQTVGVGLPARDLAYFLASSLTPAVRRELERELVGRYHSALIAHGVSDYSPGDCWDDYRIGVIQAPLISVIGCAFATATERGDTMFVHTLRRSLLAIRELGTVEIVAEVAPSSR